MKRLPISSNPYVCEVHVFKQDKYIGMFAYMSDWWDFEKAKRNFPVNEAEHPELSYYSRATKGFREVSK
jgi:hypothetical protein